MVFPKRIETMPAGYKGYVAYRFVVKNMIFCLALRWKKKANKLFQMWVHFCSVLRIKPQTHAIANSCTHVYSNYHKVQSYRMLDLTNMRGGDGKPKYLHILQFPGVFWYFNIMNRFRASERC